MSDEFIFVQLWCCQCQDVSWHLLRTSGLLDCLACRKAGRLTTQPRSECSPFPGTSLVSWFTSARSVKQL